MEKLMNERNFWRILEHDPDVMGHEFVQDPDDIPKGCAVCWDSVERLGHAAH